MFDFDSNGTVTPDEFYIGNMLLGDPFGLFECVADAEDAESWDAGGEDL